MKQLVAKKNTKGKMKMILYIVKKKRRKTYDLSLKEQYLKHRQEGAGEGAIVSKHFLGGKQFRNWEIVAGAEREACPHKITCHVQLYIVRSEKRKSCGIMSQLNSLEFSHTAFESCMVGLLELELPSPTEKGST